MQTTLIIDQFSQQSLLKRLFSYLLTGMGWSFWIYLWLPLLGAITTLTGLNTVQATSAALSSILNLIDTLNTHVVMIAYIMTAFMLWSILQWLGKQSRLAAIHKQRMLPSYNVLPHLKKQWQEAQCVIVNHDEVNGTILRIQVADNYNVELSE